MISNQLTQFFLYVVSGMAISLFFDIFRVIRKSIKTSNIITYIEDTIFWIIVGLFLIWEIFTISYGELRSYIFIGIVLGVIVYLVTISKYFINVNVKILNFFKKIVLNVINKVKNVCSHLLNFTRPILILIRKPVYFLFINFKKISKGIHIKEKNIVNKKHHNLVKNSKRKTKSINKK